MRKDKKVIGICVASMQSDSWEKHVRAICKEAGKRDYTVMIFNTFQRLYEVTKFGEGEVRVFDMIPFHKLGVLIVFSESIANDEISEQLVQKAKDAGVPVITIDRRMKGCHNVLFAYEESFEKVVRHVIEDHGCKKINFMAGFEHNEFSDARIGIFKKVLEQNDLAFEPERLAYGQFWEMPARHACEEWVAKWQRGEQSMPEAVICANDIMALTVMNVLLRCMLAAALVVLVYRNRNGLEVDFLDVGQGDAIFISMPNGTNVFIDGGSSSARNVYDKVIEPFLKYKGVRKIDFLFVTHGDADHENGWLEALDNSDSLTYIPKISNLILNSVDFVKYEALLLCEEKADMPDYTGKDKSGQEIENISIRMAERGTKVFDSEYGTTYWFGECSMVSLNACSDESPSSDSDNDNSIVLLLRYNDFSMLFTGDMTSKREAAVSASIKNYGISSLSLLKVGHHGSRYSSDEAFLANVMPETAVISCAEKNSYGHPHSEVIDRLEDIGAMIFRTDKSGAIIACIDNKSAYMTVCEYKTK